MRPKLVSMTFGMTLVVRDEQGDHQIRFSGRCPSKAHQRPVDVLRALCEFINEEFDMYYVVNDLKHGSEKIQITKPKRVDSVSNVDHLKYIRELSG